MKLDSSHPAQPTEADIRAYAHHLYVQSGWLPGRDLDNWLEAEAYLTAQLHASIAAQGETQTHAAPHSRRNSARRTRNHFAS